MRKRGARVDCQLHNKGVVWTCVTAVIKSAMEPFFRKQAGGVALGSLVHEAQ